MTPWRSANSPYSRGWWAGYDGWAKCPADSDAKAFELGKAARIRETLELRNLFAKR